MKLLSIVARVGFLGAIAFLLYRRFWVKPADERSEATPFPAAHDDAEVARMMAEVEPDEEIDLSATLPTGGAPRVTRPSAPLLGGEQL